MYTHISTKNFLDTYKYNQLMQRATPTNIKIIYIVTNIQSKLINQQTNSWIHRKTNIKITYILTNIQVHSSINKEFHRYTEMQSSDANPNNLTYIEITYIITNIPSIVKHKAISYNQVHTNTIN